MPHHLSVIYTRTTDDLKLQGMYYQPIKKTDTCILLIHGMGGNFIENIFGDVLGRTLSDQGLGYIYAHNRGYAHINDIPTGEVKPDNGFEYQRHGAMYERFSESHYDIEAWVKRALKQGYSKVILMGHSLGCAKVIYWLNKSKRTKNPIQGIILASPADMVGLTLNQFSLQQYQSLITEAKNLIKQGKYTKLLSASFDDGWYHLSAQTFLEEMVDHSPADVLPVKRNPSTFPYLETINKPILCFYGEYDSAVITSPKADLNLLRAKATSCPEFQTAILKGSNHCYENREAPLSRLILKWSQKLETISV